MIDWIYLENMINYIVLLPRSNSKHKDLLLKAVPNILVRMIYLRAFIKLSVMHGKWGVLSIYKAKYFANS